jgi:hypothetical protein
MDGAVVVCVVIMIDDGKKRKDIRIFVVLMDGAKGYTADGEAFLGW